MNLKWKLSLLAIIGIILCLFVSTASAATWETYREDISISDATVDVTYTTYVNDTGSSGSYINTTLPSVASGFTNETTYINISTTSNQTYSLTVNGNSCNSSSILDTTYYRWTLTHLLYTNQVDGANDTYINASFEFNESSGNNVSLHLSANDATITSSLLTASQTVKEKDTSTPFIGVAAPDSYWSVNDSIQFTHSIGYALSDITCTLSYANQAISEPESDIDFGVINSGSSKTEYVNYQKYGPYVYDVDNEISGDTHTVEVYVKSPEVLSYVVDWSLDPTDDVYDGAFDNINYDTLTVELNNGDLDWTQGSIEMDELTVNEQYSQNKFTFTWTEERPILEIPEKEFFIPMWATVLLIAAIVVIIVAYFYYKTE